MPHGRFHALASRPLQTTVAKRKTARATRESGHMHTIRLPAANYGRASRNPVEDEGDEAGRKLQPTMIIVGYAPAGWGYRSDASARQTGQMKDAHNRSSVKPHPMAGEIETGQTEVGLDRPALAFVKATVKRKPSPPVKLPWRFAPAHSERPQWTLVRRQGSFRIQTARTAPLLGTRFYVGGVNGACDERFRF
ncbi:uncharacterized protein SPSK_01982 [Sporothrix schenckii 1099-18]|uniref:Uncharacterized protein n=1 Tax=Sporothrix schenckii 1099-18 TaxID=1397361 RepID=A0A0F2MB16_SPOSC|nr:uncharacterized protein SPSK_01982 [Sporothrix schenckii 1099-18]KJR86893.1 hypothetical protein SPSK_01982 [Sporothrix schenckii 1099-18]